METQGEVAVAVPIQSLAPAVADVLVPIDLEGFAQLHGTAYLRYAHVMLGSREAAEHVVDEVFVWLARRWEVVLRQPSAAEAGWRRLKALIDHYLGLTGRRPSVPETAAFEAVLRGFRDRFEQLESRIGLYSAMCRLPEKQFDVMVLRFVLGYPVERTAALMGVSSATVRSNVRFAKRKLARELGLEDQRRGADA